MADDNHTPLPSPIKDDLPQVHTQTQSSSVAAQPARHGSKEVEPARATVPEESAQDEGSKDQEGSAEKSEKKANIAQVKKNPDISQGEQAAGLQVAPSAKPFPTIYDVKVPIYSDIQIEENLHKSFWTGARWLAEFCKYLLWQSHIKLKKIGSKIIRQVSR